MRKPFCLLLLFVFLPLRAQQSSALPTMENLSNPMVSSLAEDVSGDIWIGTGRGLNRYNGSAYTVWLQDTGGLRDDNVRVLASEADGSLWVGTRSGLGVLRGGRADPSWTVDARNVYSLASWDSGHLLFSAAGGLFLADKRTAAVQPVFLDPRLQYVRFTLLPDRRIWLQNLSSSAFTILDPDFRILRQFSLPERSVNGVTADADGSVWLSTSRGLLHYASDGLPSPASVPGPLAAGTDGRNVLFMAIRDGDRFVGISDAGIFRIGVDGALRQEWEYETLPGAQSCSYLLTRDNLWLSKDGRGLTNLYRHTDEHSLKLPSKYPSDALNMFYGIGDGQLLIITNKGIFRQRIATGESVRVDGPGLDGNSQLGITLRDRRGGLWVQHDYDELRHYVFEGEDRLRLDASWPIEPTSCIWDDPAGSVLLLQEGSILRFGPQEPQPAREPASPHPEFWFCGQFASGRPYFLAYDDIWLRDTDGSFVAADTGIPGPSCVWEDAEGGWWVGTRRDGIWHYDPRSGSARQIDLKAQDVDRCINSIIGDRNGNVWAAARFDFIRISDAGEDIRIFKNQDPFSASNNTNSAVVTDNGTVLFGNRERISFIMQGIPQRNPAIPIFLDGVTVNGRMIPYDRSGVLELDHRSRQLSFFFSGRNFNPGIHPIYQFRLDGYDPDRVYAGQTLRAGYSRLKSGHYTFRARVQQLDGIWGADELAVPVWIKPSPWLSWVAILIYALLGLALVGFVLQQIIRDRTNRERLELSEHEKNLLEQISQERMTFYTDVSHEFRTPLSLIYGPVKELAQSPNLSEGDRKLIGIIDRNSERMIRLTDQFLHFNRSRSSRDGLSVQRTDLTVLLQQMLRNFEYMFAQKNLRVTGDLPRELVVFCDREKVERIIFNLLSNAVKYTPEHGAITVRAALDGPQARIEVADTGIGIAPDKAEQIFGRFERLGERVGGDLPTGFGIGLNYARHLALVHKGDLSVRANDPIGSVFSFVFPWQQESYAEDAVWHDEQKGQEAQEASSEPSDAETAGPEELPRILVVEDNADMREYIRGFLSGEARVMLAGDGEQAWKSIRISAPDLIVSDVMMPYKDGYTLCKEIKNDPEFCHIPIILLTAKADMENQLHGLDLGADGYVGKPFDPAYLSALIRNLLANRRRLQAMLADRTSGSPEPEEQPEGLSASDRAFLDKCYRIVDEHLSEEEFGVTALSLEIGMSRTSVFSKLKALTGQSPNTFMTNYRLNRAMELLKTREYNVSEVGYKVGFGTLTGFSRSFKNKFGIPPSAV
ncbi:MAG: response regulator [Bacteroidales bacterium]|nr:response regulator [Bacteroidales bacterium]